MNSEVYETFMRMGIEEVHMKSLNGFCDYNKLFELAKRQIKSRRSILNEIHRIKLNSIPDDTIIFAFIEEQNSLKLLKVKAKNIKDVNKFKLIHFDNLIPRMQIL